MAANEWNADEEYVMSEPGTVCTLSGRVYEKVNPGKALVAAFYISSGYTCPLLVSTEADAVTYRTYGQVFHYAATVEYLGLTWYVSDTGYAMGGNITPSGYARKLDGSYATVAQAAQALLETANVTVSGKCVYLLKGNGVFYDNDLNVLDINEVTDEIMQQYGSPQITADLTAFNSVTIFKYDENEQRTPLHVAVKALPPVQTVRTDAIDISDSSITGIESVTVAYSGTPAFAFSFDGGETWKMHNGTAWVLLSEGSTGMQAETLMAVTSEQWQEQIRDVDEFLVRFTLQAEEDAVESILIDFTN